MTNCKFKYAIFCNINPNLSDTLIYLWVSMLQKLTHRNYQLPTDDFYKFYKNSKFCARKGTPHFKKIHPSNAKEGYFLVDSVKILEWGCD